MKNISIISLSLVVCNMIKEQLSSLLGNKIKISTFIVTEDISTINNCDLVVFTGELVANIALERAPNLENYIIAKRVINYGKINKLLSLPKGIDVLFVNDYQETCYEAIQQLENLGIDHINYIPYYPGAQLKDIPKIAVTPGEIHLCPEGLKQIIDIGARLIDIITILDILKALNLLEEKERILSSLFNKDIVYLLRETIEISDMNNNLKNRFQTIFNATDNGMIFTDNNYTIKEINTEFFSIFKFNKEDILNKNFLDVFPELRELVTSKKDRHTVDINNLTFSIAHTPILEQDHNIGHLFRFINIVDIRNIGYEASKKNKHSYSHYTFQSYLTQDSETLYQIEIAKHFANSKEPILITGESGTGKEIIAQSIHQYSNIYRDKPFIPINFSAFSLDLLESELFGYEEGAFTGALRGGKAGLFEEANNGILFLDEIGDAPLAFQIRLLRVLQESYIRRVGSTKLLPINVRIIAATNKNLEKMISENKFREDLYYRINVLPIHLRPLRERKKDIILQLNNFIGIYSNNRYKSYKEVFTTEAIDNLLNYQWKGNTREMVNFVKYIVMIKKTSQKIDISEFPHYMINRILSDNDILTEDELNSWILNKISKDSSLGRRALSRLASEEGIPLTESKIRRLINKMIQDNILIINDNDKSYKLTNLGNSLL